MKLFSLHIDELINLLAQYFYPEKYFKGFFSAVIAETPKKYFSRRVLIRVYDSAPFQFNLVTLIWGISSNGASHLIKTFPLRFQLIIEPKSMEKAIKLQLPIVLATYPFRSTSDVMTNWPDSVLKPDTHYPSSLPVFRPSIQWDWWTRDLREMPFQWLDFFLFDDKMCLNFALIN